MKKSELILAQKHLSAKQTKMESAVIREELDRMKSSFHSPQRASTSMSGTRRSQSQKSLSSSMSSLPNSMSLASLPEISSPYNNGPATFDSSVKSNMKASSLFGNHSGPPSGRSDHLSLENRALANELSSRTTTDATTLRKKQTMVRNEIAAQEAQQQAALHSNNSYASLPQARGSTSQSKSLGSRMQSRGDIFSNDYRPMTTSNPHHGSGGGGHGSSSSTAAPIVIDVNELDTGHYFMPKKKILRPDGASLLDVYESKRRDQWGKIIKAQYQEELEQNHTKRIQKEHANDEYGRKLKEQVDEHIRKKELAINETNTFAALEDATAKRTEEMQKGRVQDAIRRQKQFIQHALDDIATKHAKHELFLKEELTASTIMVNNAKKMMALDEMKKQQLRDGHKSYQESMFKENMDNIARKQKLKNDSFSEDKKINAEREKQWIRDEQRKISEANFRLKRSTEGPAHFIVDKIVEMRRKKEDELHDFLYHQDNLLNKQLKQSEDFTKQRLVANGQSLEEEWQKNTAFQLKKKQEDEERNNRILATMRKMLQDQEQEDIQKREAKRLAALRYQQELDHQLSELRQRSIDTLQKTMSEEEAKYNTKLLEQTAKFLREKN